MKKNTLRIVFIILLGLLCLKCFSQEDYAVLYKNVNIKAKGLFHDLNTTKDTLLLRSSDKIDYVYSINNEAKREVDTYVGDDHYKVALNDLSKGKHVFVVGLCALKIVFVVKVLRDKSISSTLTASKDK